jgi:hypothetical protein
MEKLDVELYLQQLTDLARLPDDAPQRVRELMEGALCLKKFFMLATEDPDESWCIGLVNSFRKMAEDIKAERPLNGVPH